ISSPNASLPAKSRIKGAKTSPRLKCIPIDTLNASCPRPKNTPPNIFPARYKAASLSSKTRAKTIHLSADR
ncbi:MAG: hypothetical protein RI897_4441, partial [Verrucomicrobiota bacterium]